MSMANLQNVKEFTLFFKRYFALLSMTRCVG